MNGDKKSQYESDAAYFIQEKPESAKRIVPMGESECREWLGCANRSGNKELIEHFVECLEKAKERC